MNSPWDGPSSGSADRPDASGPSPYSSDPYAGSPYPSDPLAPGQYGASPYGPSQYGSGQYGSGQYGSYEANPYATPYGGDPYAPAPYGGGAYGPQYGYGPGYAAGPPQSGLAVAALVCGILGFFTAGLASIGAVICGHLAWSDTKSGRQAGHGMAIAGLVLGYIPIVGWVLFWLFFAISIGSIGGA
ncbi:MAG: hypothetical protein AVDCRST_MAG54-199 [uncultured Actinomycetospora sp.]|uniref:DUF4190 domain-containing protein n=1 Tax=uncultured Actinomycetospora sp. TaxID=1135996 RepID=A0A6J4H6K8_9PSEU|nr:MAG: hypothetical protein AVDCRST_MAG54-199 [uncultured Actinomycetospora sp.]